MTDVTLTGRQILVVEDDYLIADDLCEALADAGAGIVGPCPTIAKAVACLDSAAVIDAAVLDVNLCGEMVFPFADALTLRGIPFIFATGYDEGALPDRYSDVGRLEKPVRASTVAAQLDTCLRVMAGNGERPQR
ncbi:response regulator [Sphingomonas sp. PB2P19]|uniref:response regulator n=1 Tax=Sphingomonas rhamnosi TaxID=3096156 RepID=UPI002FCB154D